MKYANYDDSSKKLLGWYDDSIHTTIPQPNIPIDDSVWVNAISNNYNFVNIDTGELSYVDFSTFLEKQEIKRTEIRQEYDSANQVDIAYMDTLFQADSYSQNLIVSVLSAGSVPTDFYWLDTNNNKITMTYTDLQGLSVELLTRGQANFDKLQTLKADISSATTEDELDNIIW